MIRVLSLLLLVAALFDKGESIAIENGLVGDPEVECLAESVQLVFATERPFIGRVYAKNLYDSEECNRGFNGDRSGADVEYQFGTCNVVRTRSLEPKGVFVTGVVVVQFHPFVLTKIDRAIRFQCFYMEADKTVDQDLEVSAITTEFQTFQVPMPICRYEILDGPGGQPVKFATIGMKVYHEWICDTDTVDIFCMEVYGCYVNNEALFSADEDANALRLLDDDGCAQDGNLLQNPDYDDSEAEGARGLRGGKETHVFKYADRPQLYFNCQIRIGVRDPGTTCQDYREQTGGQCQEAPLTRRRKRASKNASHIKDLGVMDVMPSHTLYVADIELGAEDIPARILSPSHRRPEPRAYRPTPPVDDSYCVSTGFFSAVVFFLAISGIATVSMSVVFINRRKY